MTYTSDLHPRHILEEIPPEIVRLLMTTNAALRAPVVTREIVTEYSDRSAQTRERKHFVVTDRLVLQFAQSRLQAPAANTVACEVIDSLPWRIFLHGGGLHRPPPFLTEPEFPLDMQDFRGELATVNGGLVNLSTVLDIASAWRGVKFHFSPNDGRVAFYFHPKESGGIWRGFVRNPAPEQILRHHASNKKQFFFKYPQYV